MAFFLFLHFFFFLAGFGFWLVAPGLWLLALASGFWLLLAFGFWPRASGFCGFWLGCNSAGIFFIVCVDLLQIVYQFFFKYISSMRFLFLYGCPAILHEFFFALTIFVFSNLALWLLWLLWMFFGFTILYLSIDIKCLSTYPIYII